MKKFLYFAALVSANVLTASVTFNVQSGVLRDSLGDAVNVGITAILVADTNNDGFGGDYVSGSSNFNIFDGVTFSQGNSLSGFSDDIILRAFSSIDFGGVFFGVNGTVSGLNVTSGTFSEGDRLALYWMPTITSGSHSGSVTEYGFFRSDSIDTDGGSQMAWLLPNDGANLNLFAFDPNINPGTTTGPSVLQLTARAVPEPSAFALLAGVLGLTTVVSRRRR